MFRKKSFIPASANSTSRRPVFGSFEYPLTGNFEAIGFHEVHAPLDATVLFVGLGNYGLKTLQALKSQLTEVYLGNLIEDFYFLGVGTDDSLRPIGLLSAQEVVNLGFDNTREGTQAKFLEYLQKNENSPVKNCITRVYHSTNTNPPRKVNFVFVSSLAEPDAAIAIPFCHWIRSIFQGKINQIVDFASLVSMEERSAPPLGNDGVFIALRELFRFCSDSQQKLDMGIPGVSDLAQNFLFNKVILADSKDTEVISNSILDYLALKHTSFEVARKDMLIFSDALSVAKVYLPVNQIRQAIADYYRSSLFKGGTLNFSIDSIKQEVRDFFYKPLWNHDSYPFSLIADSYLGVLKDSYYDLPPANLVEGFTWGVIYYLNEKVFPVVDFGFEILRWQLEFLKELKRVVHLAANSLAFVTERHRGYECIQELLMQMPNMEASITHLEDQVAVWVEKSKALIARSEVDAFETNDPICCISRSNVDQYKLDSQKLFPIELLEKRSKWVWKQTSPPDFCLQWSFAPLDYEGSIRDANSVSAELIEENLSHVEQSVTRIANHYIHNMDIFSEIDKSRPNGLDFNAIVLKPLLATKTVERRADTAQSVIAVDLDRLKRFTVSNQVENLECVTSFLDDPYSISIMRLDQKMPLGEMPNWMMLNQFNKVNPTSLVYTQERNALELEKELMLRRGDYFSPVFVGLMQDLNAFKTAMQAVYWGVFQATPGLDKQTYSLKIGDGPGAVQSLQFKGIAPGSLKEILYFALVYIPAESLDVTQSFYRTNFEKTISDIDYECGRIKKSTALRNQQKEKIRTQITIWEKSDDVFYRDLAKYLQLVRF